MGDWDRRFREAHDFAIQRGFSTAWPNFHEADYGDGVVYGTLLIPAGTVEFRDVPRDEYGVYQIDDVPAMFRAANDYAAKHGFAAGLPDFHQADYGAGVVYGTFLVEPGAVEFRDVPADELGQWDRSQAPAMLRAASDYASRAGFAGAFPTFHEADYGEGLVFGLVLFHPGKCAWRDVPADLLQKYSDPPTPLAVVLCRPSDVPAPAGSHDRWAQFFLPGGRDPANAARYWTELSYGQYDPSGSRVYEWIDIGRTQADVAQFTGQKQRQQLAQWGREAAARAGIHLENFTQVAFGYNVNADHGSVGGNTVVLAYAEGRPFEPTFMHHEIGHALGLGHSSSQGDGVYGDRFDIMSAMNVWTFQDALGRATGPGAAAPNLENLGWLHRSAVWRSWPATPQTITLGALNRPGAGTYLAAHVLPPARSGPGYYLEYREATDWDRGLPGPRVLVHTRNAENGPEILGAGWQPAGALSAGQQLALPGNPAPVVVRVETVDPASSRATVRVWAVATPVRYAAVVRLRHAMTGCNLHSHQVAYGHPGSSGQQQVTCFAGTDDNDLWRVAGPDGSPGDFRAGQPVQHGDTVRLEHVLTGTNLHSHAGFPSPVTGQQEVTCFGTAGVGDGNDNWRLEVTSGAEWEAGGQVRLVHVPTDAALHSHGGFSHPKWTMGQQEVTGFAGRDANDLWFATDLS